MGEPVGNRQQCGAGQSRRKGNATAGNPPARESPRNQDRGVNQNHAGSKGAHRIFQLGL